MLRRLTNWFGGQRHRGDAAAVEHEDHKVVIFGYPTAETFDETAYLAFNPDVAAAVTLGGFASGRDHFEKHGHQRTHKMPIPGAPAKVAALRTRKAARLAGLFKPELQVRTGRDGVFDTLTPEARARFGIVATDNVSSHDYDGETIRLIEANRGGLILDCGAGSRPVYYDNVVNYEIARYPSTDVVGVAEALPFKDSSFDLVFSYSVLEHVKQPFMAAREIARVLKPDGLLRVVVPFLQPLHGYPSHYFNMTQFGLRSLFEDELEIESQFAGKGFGPAWTLFAILGCWRDGLPESERAAFLDLRVADLLTHPTQMLQMPHVRALPEATNFQIASATGLVARKRKR